MSTLFGRLMEGIGSPFRSEHALSPPQRLQHPNHEQRPNHEQHPNHDNSIQEGVQLDQLEYIPVDQVNNYSLVVDTQSYDFANIHQIEAVMGAEGFDYTFFMNWTDEVMQEQNPPISRKQLVDLAESYEWINRFENWSRIYEIVPSLYKKYTWDDMVDHLTLQQSMVDWLRDSGLQKFSDYFEKNNCFSLSMLVFVNNEILESWGLQPMVRRFILNQIRNRVHDNGSV